MPSYTNGFQSGFQGSVPCATTVHERSCLPDVVTWSYARTAMGGSWIAGVPSVARSPMACTSWSIASGWSTIHSGRTCPVAVHASSTIVGRRSRARRRRAVVVDRIGPIGRCEPQSDDFGCAIVHLVRMFRRCDHRRGVHSVSVSSRLHRLFTERSGVLGWHLGWVDSLNDSLQHAPRPHQDGGDRASHVTPMHAPPNKDFESRNKRTSVRFRSTLQGCEC